MKNIKLLHKIIHRIKVVRNLKRYLSHQFYYFIKKTN